MAGGSSSRDEFQLSMKRQLGNESEDKETTESLKCALVEFCAITSSVDDIVSVYRNLRPFWAANTVSSLVDPALKVLSTALCSRCAVLDYIGMLTHEATHIFYSKKENPHVLTDSGNLEQAVRKICVEVQEMLAVTKSRVFALEIVVWACSLFIEICKYNHERPFAKKTGMSAKSLLSMFEMCPAISSAMRLGDKAIASLLKIKPDECISVLIDASSNGFYFDWIWLHIADLFPDAVVPQLFKIGIGEFKQYLQTAQDCEVPIEVHESYKQKFLSFSELISYLATMHNSELRNVTRNLIQKDQEAFEADLAFEEQLHEMSLPFLFKMITNSPDILRFFVDNAHDLVSTTLFIRACLHIARINKQCILPVLPNTEYTYAAFLRQMIFYLSPNALVHIVDIALPVAFDENVFNGFPNMDPNFRSEMRNTARKMLDEVVGIIATSIHTQSLLTFSDNSLMKRIASDTAILNQYVTGAMSNNESSKFFIPLLHSFCLLSGITRSAEVVARFICIAKNEQQIAVLGTLLKSLVPYLPALPEHSVTTFFSNYFLIQSERRRAISITKSNSSDSDNSLDTNWHINLRTLNEWTKNDDGTNPFNSLRFEFTKHYGQLMVGVLRWLLDSINQFRADKIDCNSNECRRMQMIEGAMTFCASIGPSALLKPKLAYKISAYFAALLILLLKNIAKEDESHAFSLFMGACTNLKDFLQSQVTYVREQFIVNFIDEAFMHSLQLFNCPSLNAWEIEARFSSGNQNSVLLYESRANHEQSLFEMARKLPLYPQKAVELAHSGVIGQGARRMQKETKKKGDFFRRLVFLDCLQRFCSGTNAEGSAVPNYQMYKQLAMKITDRIGKDGLAISFMWEDWEQARDVIARYIAVSKRLMERPFVWDVMTGIAEHYPCLWYCAPLLKAMLASLIIQFENSPDQKSLPSENHIVSLDKWFLLLKKGQMLSPHMAAYIDVISRVSRREGFFILLDVWRYYQSLMDTEIRAISTISSAFDRAISSNTVEPIQGDPSKFRDSCRLVIQRNISRIGALFPLIFADEFDETKLCSAST